MLIRFACIHCDERLALNRQAVGSEVACPRCGFLQTVPEQDDEDAEVAAGASAGAAGQAAPPNQPAPADESPRPASEFRIPNTEFTGSCQFRIPAPAVPRERRVPSDMILYPRRMFYVEAGLYLLVAGGALAVGFWIGRGGTRNDQQLDPDAAARSRVPVEGRIVYDPGIGKSLGDTAAVVILLPAGKYPISPWVLPPLGRTDFLDAENRATLRPIEELGGAWATADTSGNFSLFVPRRGHYRLLVVSHHATRPTTALPAESDQTELTRYFDQLDRLLRGFKYRWTLNEIDLGSGPLDVDFGRPGAP